MVLTLICLRRQSSGNSSGCSSVACFILGFLLLTQSFALRFYLHDQARRCFRFEAPYDARVLGHASIANGKGYAEVNIDIRDKRGHIVYQSRITNPNQASFSLKTPKFDPANIEHIPEEEEEEAYHYDPRDIEGWFDVCLTLYVRRTSHDVHSKRAISFWIRPQEFHPEVEGITNQASDSQVHSIAHSLQQMQDVLKTMVTDIVTLQQRERRLVDHSHATAQRLIVLAVVSLVILVVTAIFQYMHFKSYFKSKKLL